MWNELGLRRRLLMLTIEHRRKRHEFFLSSPPTGTTGKSSKCLKLDRAPMPPPSALPPTRLALEFRTPSKCLPARNSVPLHTVAVEPPAREISSRHRVDRRSLLPLAARRDAVAACATCVDLRMAVRTVATQFPAVMNTIRTGYWKNSSSAAISHCDIRKSHRITPSPKLETPDVRALSTPN